MLLHHPFALALTGWLMLVEALQSLGTITLRLDATAIVVGLAPLLAIIVNYHLTKRQATRIATHSSEKVAEVHTLVNSQRDQADAKIVEQDRRLAEQDARIVQLETQLTERAGPSR